MVDIMRAYRMGAGARRKKTYGALPEVTIDESRSHRSFKQMSAWLPALTSIGPHHASFGHVKSGGITHISNQAIP
jgi:hypothetical protein